MLASKYIHEMKSLFLNFIFKNYSAMLLTLFTLPTVDWIVDTFRLKHVEFTLYVTLFACITLDVILGLAGAKKDGEEIKSRKGLRSVFKAMFYFIFLVAVSQLHFHPAIEGSEFRKGILYTVNLFTYILAILWEVQSWGENYKRLWGYKPKFFTFLDLLSNALEDLLTKKIKDINNNESK